MRSISTTALAAALFLTVASSAQALPITFTGAPAGLTFSIESVAQDPTDMFAGDSTSDTYLITLKLVTNGYTDVGGQPNYLASIALDVATNALQAGQLSSYPSGLVWTSNLNQPVNSSGKCGSTGDGGLCLDEDPDFVNPGDTNLALATNNAAGYQFVFRYDMPQTGGFASPVLYVGISTIHTNGDYKQIDTSPIALREFTGEFNPQIGTTSVATPEPASLLLFGSGVVLVARRLRRRKVSA